jgi:hypothetical protein
LFAFSQELTHGHGDGPPPQLHPKLTKRREGEAFDASFEYFIIDDSTDFRR